MYLHKYLIYCLGDNEAEKILASVSVDTQNFYVRIRPEKIILCLLQLSVHHHVY